MCTRLKSLPAKYDSTDVVEFQEEATSKDGTIVPYFVVMKNSLKRDGSNPTLVYGYGGFVVSILPSYSATIGCTWVEQGNIYVSANIRGGGEFGPKWHQEALKENSGLKRLELGGNNIGEAGAFALIDGLKSNCSLEKVRPVGRLLGFVAHSERRRPTSNTTVLLFLTALFPTTARPVRQPPVDR